MMPPAEPLTPTELEVLRLVADGLSNDDIAQAQCVTVNTVKTHLAHLYGKLGADNRTQLAVFAHTGRVPA